MPAPILQFKRGNAGVAGTVPALRPGEPAISLNNFDFFIGIDTSVANNKFFGSHRYWGREDGTNSLRLKLVDKDGSNYVAIAASDTLSGIATYRLPNTTNGTTGDFLKLKSVSGGFYDLEWSAVPSGSFTIVGDTGTDTFTTGETLTFAGTANEIETTVTNNQVQIGLPDNVVVGGALTVTTGAVIDGVQIGVSGANVIDTVSGNLTLNSASGTTIIDDFVNIQNNLNVTGNVTIGGTTLTLTSEDVFIKNKDIVLGYTTNTSNADASTDTTANHAGVAIASTEGTPLASFTASGINTLPDTYKQMMWFQNGTLGFGTDTFAFNYGVAIGTTQMANNVRLAVGTGVTVGDTTVTAANFYGALTGNVTGNTSSADQVKTVTASDTNANYYVTFVDANNGSATNENVYTDDGIYYNPGANKLTTQHAEFTGDVLVSGITTLAGNVTLGDASGDTITVKGTATFEQPVVGTIGTATRATEVDITGTSSNADYYVTFVDTLAGQTGETLRVGAGLSVNPSNGDVKTTGKLSVGNPGDLTSYIKAGGGSDAMYLYANGDVAFQQKVIVGGLRSSSNSNNTLTLNGLDATFAGNLAITGITTIGTGVGITQFSASVSTGSSTSSVPTSSAVIDYVGSQFAGIDLTLGLNADAGGPSTVNTSQTLSINGTASEVETSVSGQTITVGLPDAVVVGTSLSAPTLRTGTIQSSNTGDTAITITANDVTIADDLTVGGNLYVNGNTTQVNTTAITVEDRTVELGVVDGSAPSSATTWDLGVLFNYYDGSAKKSAVVWEHGDQRFKLASVLSADSNGTDANTPQLTVTTFAPIEVSELWINNSCTGGASQVIACSGSELVLQNITVDAGTF